MTIADFIGKYWGKPGGAERATYQMFLTELAQLLGAPTPDPGAGGELGDYQFEGPVKSEAVFLSRHNKRMDLYKRDCFILEAKQSQLKPGETLAPDPPEEALEPVRDLFGNVIGHAAASGKRAPRYDRLMADARIQAERYGLALPGGHKPPPFLIVADIGRAFELYFDWTGDGRGYGFFPDQQNYRIALDALASDALVGNSELSPRDLLRAIWLDPASVDPRKRAVAVTRDIAERLSRVAAQLESDEAALRKDRADFEIALGIEQTALFLMRVLFCMFAEDVELLPKGSFTQFLNESRSKSDNWWRAGLHDLWAKMNHADAANRFWSYGDAIVRHFNGNLFSSATVYDLPQEFRGELYEAAKRNWRSVEPAIFGTLLEQVLTKGERAKLGAHYTPRPYVQRLVNATIGDVLNPEWDAVREKVAALLYPSSPLPLAGGVGGGPDRLGDEAEAGPPLAPPASGRGTAEALALVRAFHQRLCDLRVLDPACGTGNFLYVAMELLLQLEGEAIQLAAELGETIAPAIHPNQFLGLELNPRAAVIAELVLWIGWLRHRLANHPDAVADPVLPTLTNINFGTHGGYDAVLRHTPTGEPDLANPLAPAWPEADFIVGNPPFKGGKDMRAEFGGAYVEALWQANPRVPKSADFVMQWWDRAAHALVAPGSRLIRFGFVTTNSITQTFSRRVIEAYLKPPRNGEGNRLEAVEGSSPPASPARDESGNPSVTANEELATPPPRAGDVLNEDRTLSLVLAIPDHPWTRATKDAAAVRIAMTVAQAGAGADANRGRLVRIVGERGLDSDAPVLEESEDRGRINADLTLGADVTGTQILKANEGLSCNGMMINGRGFKITKQEASLYIAKDGECAKAVIRPYMGGGELVRLKSGGFVIDLFGLTESEARRAYPATYSHVLTTVKPQRDKNRIESVRDRWWIFEKPRSTFRPALVGLVRYIATTETSKHRIFQFLDAAIVPDHMIIAIGTDDAFHLGVLVASLHCQWSLRAGGWLGMGNDNRYNKSKVFDPFPFPDATPAQRAVIAELAEELDATRKAALAETPDLTMTEIYNWREKLRAQATGGAKLSPHEEDRARAARAGIVDRLHQQIDAAVADAYGWGDDWKRGDLAPAEIVARLVALNATRAAEEQAGHVRWLRPDYQLPRFGAKAK